MATAMAVKANIVFILLSVFFAWCWDRRRAIAAADSEKADGAQKTVARFGSINRFSTS
jgi:hypothetical protein